MKSSLYISAFYYFFKEFEKSAQGDWQVHCHIENYPT